MRRRTKWLAAGAAAVGLGPWLPGWLTAAGLDAWAAPALRRQVEANRRTAAELDGALADVRDQLRAKVRLSDELAAGRLTLAEATDQFAAMVAASPRAAADLRRRFPDAATDRERAARHAVEFTRARLADPAERDGVSGRVATELAALFPAARPDGG
jgi:hypothetical protein